MRTVFATFNFKGGDLAVAEKLYQDNHVRLTLQLPHLRQYITGLVRPQPRIASPYRAAFNYFDDDAALRWALHKSPAAKPLLEDGAAHLRVNRWLELDSEIVVPFESRRPGLRCFVLATEFQLKADEAGAEAAERHYLDYYVALARELPKLRHYMISKYQIKAKPTIGESTSWSIRNPLRVATLVFDSADAMRDDCHSPLGEQLKREQEATITNIRVYPIDATVQL